MIEREAIYPMITHVGNIITIEPPPAYCEIKGDSYDRYTARRNEYKAALKRQDDWFGDSASIAQYIPKRNWSKVGYLPAHKRSALRFFLRPEEWADKFYTEVYGSAENAYLKTGNKEELILDYIEWFEDRKRKLRERMNEKTDLTVVEAMNSAGIGKRSGRPLSHGGVANLLKTLTKTMEKQGADITSIAKMQYAICKQAGIYIVDEFIEDVAVIMGEGVEQ